MNKVALKYLVYARESLIGLRVPALHGRTSFSLSRGPRPEGGALVKTSRPMVHCAPALQLAGRLGSFFQIEAPSRCSVSWASGGGWVADLTAPAGAGRPRGQSEPAEESGDAELLPSIPPRQASTRLGRWAPQPAPVPGLVFSEGPAMATQPNSSTKKKEEKGKNIQVVVRCR